MRTGPRVGTSSVDWSTPAGVITSIAFGAVPVSIPQIGLTTVVEAHRPNRNGAGVGANPRAWSGLNPSWPCSTTVKVHPGPGVPSAASDTNIVMYREAWLAETDTVPSDW